MKKCVGAERTSPELLFCDRGQDRSEEEFIISLLAEARHFCDAYALDMGALDRRAHNDYLDDLYGTADRDVDPDAVTMPRLSIPAHAWEDISEHRNRSVLRTSVLIGTTSHHLKAIEVRQRHGVQCAVAADAEEELSDLHASCAAQGPFETVRLEGRDYVMTLTPYGR